jgi:hypothetical protein
MANGSLMIEILTLFEIENGTCQFPTKKASTAYVYGCRCNRCMKHHMEYYGTYRSPNLWTQCHYCDQTVHKTKQLPVCHLHETPFMKRCRRFGWDWILSKINHGRCEICNSRFMMGASGGSGNWQVDHDHNQGERVTVENARGLLCGSCNSRLGHYEAALRDGQMPAILAYIEHYNKAH